MSDTHTLYRFFDAQGVLLYVGRTVSPSRRWREHERSALWFEDVASATREVYGSAEDVDLAERAAIRSEGPLHNIALTGRPVRKPTPKPIRSTLPTDKHQMRLQAAGVEVEPCDGDETGCECADCHHLRENAFEDLRARYDWHPVLSDEIDRVERLYYEGAWLCDWYYDLFDIDLIGRMRLVSDSKVSPIPAHVEIEDSLAVVDCPICGGEHRYVFPAGFALDKPIQATCSASAVPAGGQLQVFGGDWLDVRDRQYGWGEDLARRIRVAA